MLIAQGEEKKLYNETLADQVVLYTTADWKVTWLVYKRSMIRKKNGYKWVP